MDYDLPDYDMEDQERCEAQVRFQLIDPAIKNAGWSPNQIRVEYVATAGRVMVDSTTCVRDKRVRKLDYCL